MFYSDEILNNAKLLLGITDQSKDNILNFIIDDAINAVLAYCRLQFLPNQLVGLVSQIAVRVYRESGYGTEELPEDVKSISEGDRSIAFAKRANTDGILTDFKSRLKPFVNKRGRLPSEVSEREK